MSELSASTNRDVRPTCGCEPAPGQASGLQSVEAVAAMAAEGDAEAFAELFRRFHPRLLRFLEKRLAGSGVEAEEVTQEAFAKAWSSIRQFDSRYRFSTWIYTIARRTAIDAERKRRQTSLSLVSGVADRQQAAVDRVENADSAANVWAHAQAILNAEQYSALWLRYAEDLTLGEISAVLQRPSITVRVLLHRARSKLNKALHAAEIKHNPKRHS